jgi:osmotically-inducible protein OsmY
MAKAAAIVVLPCLPSADDAQERADTSVTLAAQVLEDLHCAEHVRRALGATGYPPLRKVEVLVQGRRVILRGSVPSYFMKQVAQAAALDVPGIGEVVNEVEVVRSS